MKAITSTSRKYVVLERCYADTVEYTGKVAYVPKKENHPSLCIKHICWKYRWKHICLAVNRYSMLNIKTVIDMSLCTPPAPLLSPYPSYRHLIKDNPGNFSHDPGPFVLHMLRQISVVRQSIEIHDYDLAKANFTCRKGSMKLDTTTTKSCIPAKLWIPQLMKHWRSQNWINQYNCTTEQTCMDSDAIDQNSYTKYASCPENCMILLRMHKYEIINTFLNTH